MTETSGGDKERTTGTWDDETFIQDGSPSNTRIAINATQASARSACVEIWAWCRHWSTLVGVLLRLDSRQLIVCAVLVKRDLGVEVARKVGLATNHALALLRLGWLKARKKKNRNMSHGVRNHVCCLGKYQWQKRKNLHTRFAIARSTEENLLETSRHHRALVKPQEK